MVTILKNTPTMAHACCCMPGSVICKSYVSECFNTVFILYAKHKQTSSMLQ